MWLGLILAIATPKLDPCEAVVPTAVRRIVRQQFPTFRIARTADYDPETLRLEQRYHGGGKCIAVSSADYDGDNRPDFAFLIANRRGKTFLVVARNLESGWKLERLSHAADDGPGCCYVNTLEPGKYENVYGAPPSEPGEVQTFESHLSGIVSGATESSGVAFFRHKSKWIHVWISD